MDLFHQNPTDLLKASPCVCVWVVTFQELEWNILQLNKTLHISLLCSFDDFFIPLRGLPQHTHTHTQLCCGRLAITPALLFRFILPLNLRFYVFLYPRSLSLSFLESNWNLFLSDHPSSDNPRYHHTGHSIPRETTIFH